MHKKKVIPLLSWENFGELSRGVSIRVSQEEVVSDPLCNRLQAGYQMTPSQYRDRQNQKI